MKIRLNNRLINFNNFYKIEYYQQKKTEKKKKFFFFF